MAPHHRRPALFPPSCIGLPRSLPPCCQPAPAATVLGQLADELRRPGASRRNRPRPRPRRRPYHLKLSRIRPAPQPGHAALAAATAGGFTQYAYAFVAFEADRLDATDARAAEQLRHRAARFLPARARPRPDGLEARHPGFGAALARPDSPFQLAADDVPSPTGALPPGAG